MADENVGKETPQAQRGRWQLGLPQLWALVALAGIWIVLNLTLVRPHDYWWHVAAGEWIVEHGRVPGVDLFSYTRLGEPYAFGLWWLSQVALYLLLRAGGLPLTLFVHALVITTSYWLLLTTSRRAAGGDLRAAAIATIAAAAVGYDNWNVRPQFASVFFFSLTLYLLDRHRASGEEGRGKVLWVLPPLFTLWANSHGGFVAGLLLVGAHLLADLLDWLRRRQKFPRRLLLVTLLSAVATVFTPLGLDVLPTVAALTGNPIVRHLIVEWLPPTLYDRMGLLFFALAGTLVALLLASRHRLSTHEAVRLLLFGGLALAGRRNTIWFGFVAAPAMATCLSMLARQRGTPAGVVRGRPLLNWMVATLVCLLAVLSLPWLRPHLPLPEERQAYISAETPVEAVEFLRTLPASLRVFHGEGYGSYMIWASPEVPVFIDPRFDLYPPAQWSDLLALNCGRYDWETILERYEVDTLLLERESQPALIEAALSASAWKLVYEDHRAVIFRQADQWCSTPG